MKYIRLTEVLVFSLFIGLLAVMPGCDTVEFDDDGDGINLQEGAVFTMTNARDGNTVVAFSRAEDGTLTLVGSFETGGTGSGSFEDSANSIVLGNASGESAPNNNIEAAELLFVANPGSNNITIFSVEEETLERVELQASGGTKPVSLTVNNGLLYVLHSGEITNDLFDDEGNIIVNCTTGNLPSITGFTVSEDGQLDPIPNSTRTLSGDSFSGCAQVSFNPSGNVLVVTERAAVGTGPNNEAPAGDEGVIVTFTVNNDGTLSNKRLIDATGQGPFGFTFRKDDGLLITTEQFDGPLGPRDGAAAAYAVNSDGTLDDTSASVETGGTDTCWIVVTDDGNLAFATSFFNPTPRISSFRVTESGELQILEEVAFEPMQGASDISLSRDSEYLYQLNSFAGTINVFTVGSDGSLTLIQTVQATPQSDTFARIGLAAF